MGGETACHFRIEIVSLLCGPGWGLRQVGRSVLRMVYVVWMGLG